MAKNKTVQSPEAKKISFDDGYLQKLLDDFSTTGNYNTIECKPEIKYEEYDNKHEPILYIILNKDALVDKGVKITAISHLTSAMATKFHYNEMNARNYRLYQHWLESFGGYGNTVILEADEDTIYDNCMSQYDNVEFEYLIDDSTRVAHHNWKLDCPQHLGFAFFGIKNEMPKWIRKLPLYK